MLVSIPVVLPFVAHVVHDLQILLQTVLIFVHDNN